ncbi:put. protein B1 [Black beetle virus]|nr:protein B1 [Flock House virus]YP_057021.1 put. protein B1 [Black beetle virus]P68828.1 RecName: Full=Protein B1 [Black beetle virus]P68829.1 RecName: Full=Protein B1 [Flock House virus]AAA42745.1 B1 protein [Black beetle virus]CAA26239.1 put. protein B1 [Black beetle virus]CAA54400.1 protein B1 [Flock House virus]
MLNDAKQTRANPGTSRPHSNGGGSSHGNELPRRTEQRAQGPRQPARLPKQGKTNGKSDGNITAGETQRGGIPRGKGPRGGKTNTRRTPPKAGAQPQPSNNRK